jgi:hypothetical protein
MFMEINVAFIILIDNKNKFVLEPTNHFVVSEKFEFCFYKIK